MEIAIVVFFVCVMFFSFLKPTTPSYTEVARIVPIEKDDPRFKQAVKDLMEFQYNKKEATELVLQAQRDGCENLFEGALERAQMNG